ncbi:hypothetical protein SSX86_003546 [Deinandra increscens subsp. villosa]|uniref:No apical meristem-associated C-terminal domain-containing protein n=1 Tax=Deinandra increscens subsp. villosa TaxID=3103831 RepID=A0AAP0HA09_9ASTR
MSAWCLVSEDNVRGKDSGGSTKRSRTTEKGEYFVNSNLETPTSSGSRARERPIGRDAAKKKGKGKTSNEIIEECRAMRLTRDNEFELMKKKIELDQEKVQLMKEKKQEMKENELMKMQLVHLNTLLGKESLSLEEENMKRSLMVKFYGN